MGQFTEGRVQICMDNAQEAEKLFKHLERLNSYVENHYQGDASYYNHEIFHGKEFTEIRVEFCSGRYANCEWQGEIIIAESLPYYKSIIEFSFEIPNCESWFVGDEPHEWEEGGIFYNIAQRIEKHRLISIGTPSFELKEDRLHVSMKLEGEPFDFEIAVDEMDYWIGNENFDVHYYREGWEWEDYQKICVYRVKDGTTDTSKEGEVAVYDIRNQVPLRPLKVRQEIIEDGESVPVKWVNGEEGFYDPEQEWTIRQIAQTDDSFGGGTFNLHLLIGGKEAYAYSVDFEE